MNTQENTQNIPKKGETVTLNDDFSAAQFEGKVFAFWERYKRHITIAIAAVFIAIVAYKVVLFFQERQLQAIQQAFLEAEGDNAALLSFAEAYLHHPLSGLAYLRVADERYASGDYIQAIQHYQAAYAALTQMPIFASRAQLGEGMAHLRSDTTEVGVETLKTLAADTKVISTLRAQAAYNLAIYALQTGRSDAYKAHLKTLEGLPGNVEFWRQKARALGNTVPPSATPDPEVKKEE